METTQTKTAARVLRKRFVEANLTHGDVRDKQRKEEAEIVTITVSHRVVPRLHFYRQKADSCK